MAYVTAVTIGTSNKVSVDYQSQEVNVSVTFELERSDGDLESFVADKAAEVERAHSTIWQRIRELRSERKAQEIAERAHGQPAEASPAPEPQPAQPAGAQPRTERPTRRRKPAETPPEIAATAVNGSVNGSAQSTADGVPVPETTAPLADVAHRNGAAPSGVAVASAPPPTHPPEAGASTAQQRAILSLANRATMTDEGLAELLGERFGKSRLEELTKHEAAQLLMELQRGDRR